MKNGDRKLQAIRSIARATAPSQIPVQWVELFESLTGPDSGNVWGLRAAISITRYRKTHRQGPTFAELFAALGITSMPVPVDGKDADAGSGQRDLYQFRRHVAVHWRRLGWIQWDHRSRSLRVGRAFSVASRAWAAARATK